MLTIIIAYVLYALDNIIREMLRIHTSEQPKVRHDPSSLVLIVYTLIIPICPFLAVLDVANIEQTIIPWVGIVLILLGTCVHIVAQRTLQHFYTGTLIAKGLITAGIYSKIRHPGYLGNLLIASGFGMACGSLLVLLVMVGLFPLAYGFRIHREEQLQAAAFGTQYSEYKSRTKRLLPYLF